ncbi:hypothetical protein BGZ63DRAFT_7443 [Mariannaea sp. PMI_226]|nr:hypothetical protein BGZ63DRAFT_7443 [Mariannaea sp. PMI_226]
MRVDILLREEVVCPSGTTWFACSMGDFRGCCSEDPCEAGRCKRGHVDLTILPTESEAATSESRSMTTSIKGHGGSQSDDNLLPSESSEGDTMSTITTKDAQSTTMTDSGITHTIPNSNRVTVTKHTVIVTDKAPTPISTSVIVSSSGTQWSAIPSLSGSAPAETTPAGDSVEIATNSSPSTGMIAGVAIGGAIALGICTFLLIRFLRRTRGVAVGMGPDERFSIEDHPDNDHGEKSFLQAMSPHNTGSQGSQGTTYTSNMQGSQRRGDPFAPFGGLNPMTYQKQHNCL